MQSSIPASPAPRFTVEGPYDGLYHVTYPIIGTPCRSSICCVPSLALAEEACALANAPEVH